MLNKYHSFKDEGKKEKKKNKRNQYPVVQFIENNKMMNP